MFMSVEAMFASVEAMFAFVDAMFALVEIMVTPIEGVVALVETMYSPIKRHDYAKKGMFFTPASVEMGKCDVVTCDFVTLSTFRLFRGGSQALKVVIR